MFSLVLQSWLGDVLVDWFPFLSILSAGISIHAVIYVALVIIIIYLVMQKSYRPEEPVVLTDKEIQECINDFTPQPLFPSLNEQQRLDIDVPIVTSASDTTIIVNGKECTNLATISILNLANHPEIKQAAVDTLRKYGPGSCGPRGFYGTMDIHLKFEDEAAKFFRTEGAIFYTSGLAVLTSVISCYSKRGDIIVCDDHVRHGIEVGCYLSRSLVYSFKHNDMEDLESTLKLVCKEQSKKKLTRRWILVESLSLNSGTICPLDRVLELAKTYKFRVILDESHGVGVLGDTGRGGIEHFKLNAKDFDLIVADVGTQFGTVGGVCVGRRKTTEHQRISGSGYCFSASNPPYLVASAIKSIELLLQRPQFVKQVRDNAKFLRDRLSSISGIVLDGQDISPIIHVRLDDSHCTGTRLGDEQLLQRVVNIAYENAVALTRAKYVHTQRVIPAPSIRVTINAAFTRETLSAAADTIERAFAQAFAESKQ